MEHLLEVIAFNIESCHIAQDYGASRVELCDSPPEGGTTPSYGLIRQARRVLKIPLYVMIRPRGGDFLYSDQEIDVMYEDIRMCRDLGVDGVVLGILTADGSVDVARTAHLVEAAHPMGVTFHRAFDRVSNFQTALSDVIQTGCERILTSGLQPKADAAIDTLTDLVKIAGDDIIIMAGSGINSTNIKMIARLTGIKELHSSASTLRRSSMKYQNIHLNETAAYVTADAEEVRLMADALKDV